MGKPIPSKQCISALFAGAAISTALLVPSLASANTEANTEVNTLPDAKAGECYAKVLVPPSYKTETVESLVSEAAENILVVPAKFSDDTERVVTKEASTVITAIAPEYEKAEKTIVVVKGSKDWVRGGLESNMIASTGDLAEIESAGHKLGEAKPGICFYEHYKPATINKKEENVLISEATETLEVIPASFRPGTKEIMVSPKSDKYVSTPVSYKTVQAKVLVEPAKSVWKKGKGLVEKVDHVTGEIMCRVDIPAVYKEFSKKIVQKPAAATLVPVPETMKSFDVSLLDKDAQEVRNPVAATYETVETFETVGEPTYSWAAKEPGDENEMGKHTGKVICLKETPAVVKTFEQTLVKTPGRFETKTVDAVHEDVSVKKLVSNAVITKTPIPAKNQSFTKTVKIADARLEWRPVLCETNVSTEAITSIQKALDERGYESGETPGVIDQAMFNAIEQFQKDENLAQGGLTLSTIEALGLEL